MKKGVIIILRGPMEQSNEAIKNIGNCFSGTDMIPITIQDADGLVSVHTIDESDVLIGSVNIKIEELKEFVKQKLKK